MYGTGKRYGEDHLSDRTEMPQVRRGFLEEAAFMLRLEVTLRAFIRPRCLQCAHYELGTVWKAEKDLSAWGRDYGIDGRYWRLKGVRVW